MAALQRGRKAPIFTLPQHGKPTSASLEELVGDHPAVLLVFYKAECPTCKLAMPFFDRMAARSPLPVLAIAENDAAQTLDFQKIYRISLPTVLEPPPYEISEAYGLTNVPTAFLVRSDGVVERTEIGFDKNVFEDLDRTLHELAGQKRPGPLFTDRDDVPQSKPG